MASCVPPTLHVDESSYENSIFGFIAKKMDELQAILSDSVDITASEFKFPEIIIVGDESNGKSSLLENITKCHIFPKDRGYCTKRPIRFISKYDICRKFVVRDTANQSGFEFTSDEEVYTHISDMFTKMGTGNLSEKEIVIEYASPDNHNFEFVDLPGIKSYPASAQEQTVQMTNKYLAEKNNIVMLAYSVMTTSSANCSTLTLINAHKREKDTIMVLTMMDKITELEEIEYKKKLGDAMENTFFVISNLKPTFDEVSWFKKHNITENVGVNKLLAHTEELFMKYVNNNWHTNIILKLESQKDALRQERTNLGTTDADKLEFYKYFLNKIYDKTFCVPENLFEKPLVEYCPTITTKHTTTFAEIKNDIPVVTTKTWDVVKFDPSFSNEFILEQICIGIVNKSMKLITEHSKALLMDDFNPNYDETRNPSCMCSSDPTNTSVTCKALQYADISCQNYHALGPNRTTFSMYPMHQIKNLSESLDRYLINVQKHIETVLLSIRTDLEVRIQFGFLKTYLHKDQQLLDETEQRKMFRKCLFEFFTDKFTGFSYDFSSPDFLIENVDIKSKRRSFMAKIEEIDLKIDAIRLRE